MSPWTMGPYDLSALAGAGGAAEVWAAHHRELDLPVAIKLIMHAPQRADPRRVDSHAQTDHARFRHEAALVARLDHPRVVRVYDLGDVPERAPYPEGTPFLVMEWLGGGTLAQNPPRDWGSLRQVVRDVASALAHAHARGVLHRDLKPANVLLAAPGDVRVVDFGIARTMSTGGMLEGEGSEPLDPNYISNRISGTPTYMAPEQASARFGAEGPWTDLYALGVMTWHLLTGAPPFHARSPRDTMRAHLHSQLPPFLPRWPVPSGLERVLLCLLARSPQDRFSLAADLIAELDAIEAGPVLVPSLSETDRRAFAPVPVGPTLILPETDALDATDALDDTAGEGEPLHTEPEPHPAEGIEGRRGRAVRWELPPLGSESLRPESPRSIGLGLFGLRVVPFVGRKDERQLLWNELRSVCEHRQPRAVVVRGLAGFGKSRLVASFAEHAEEVGAARTILARCGPDIHREAALRGALLRWLSCGDDTQLAARLAGSGLPATEQAAILAALEEGGAGAGHHRAVWTSLLGAAVRDRPAILWIDRAPFGPEVVGAALALLEACEWPVLCVCTVDSDELLPEGLDLAALERLEARSTPCPVGPLDTRDAQALVLGWLGLAPEIAGEVLRRADGDPSFIGDLIGGWVRTGRLVPGAGGFAWGAQGPAGTPEGPAALHRQKVAAVMASLEEKARESLVLAALLGTTVRPDEWQEAAIEAGATEPRLLLGRLLAARLLVPIEGHRYLFAGSAVREAILEEAGEVAALHRACALILERRRLARTSRLRLGRHWLGAGEPLKGALVLARAVGSMGTAFVAAEHRRAVADIAAAVHTLAQQTPPLPQEHVLYAWLQVIEADQALIRGDLTEAATRLQVLDLAVQDEEVQRTVRAGLAQCYLLLGQPEQVLALEQSGGMPPHVRALVELGRLDEAERVVPKEPRSALLLQRAAIARLRGDREQARLHLETVLRIGMAEGDLWNLAEAHSAMGDLCREAGERLQAERWYGEALHRFRALGSGDVPVVELNLSLLDLAAARHGIAGQRLERCQAAFTAQRRTFLLGAAYLGLAAVAAAEADWALVRVYTEQGLPRVQGFVESDLAWLCEQAGGMAAGGGEPEVARPLLALATAQWKALGRDEDAARVDRMQGPSSQKSLPPIM